MYYMKNKANVAATFTFSVFLWAIDPNTNIVYPIAMQNTGLIFQQSDFTGGTIT